MCDVVNIAISHDHAGPVVQVTSGTDQGVRVEHAADVALRVYRETLKTDTTHALSFHQAVSDGT